MFKVPVRLRPLLASVLLLLGDFGPARAGGVDVGGLIGGFGGLMQGAVQADQQRQYLERQQQIQRQQQLLYEQQLRYQQQQLEMNQRQPEPALQPPPVVRQEQQARAPSYTVDGHALGQQLAPETLPADFRCHPSEQFPGFQWCRSRTLVNDVWTSSSIILSPTNAIVYDSKFFEAANFQPGAVASEINRLSTLHRQQASLVRMPGPAVDGGGVIATWGALTLVPIDAATVNALASGGSVTAGVMVDFLNDIRESAKRGLPIYRLAGGAGYYWIARYDRRGQGKLRYGVADAQAFDLPKPPPPPPPPAPVVTATEPVQPVVAPPPPAAPAATVAMLAAVTADPPKPAASSPVSPSLRVADGGASDVAAAVAASPQSPPGSETVASRGDASASNVPVPSGADAERRIALVIGNSSYEAVPGLPNPKRDAGSIADALRERGFDVVTVLDGTRSQMIGALQRFQDQADGSDWALVYFAGHGLEYNDHNYLIPIDARLANERDVEDEAITLDRIETAVAGARKLRLIMLDACRNNPFLASMTSRGTARSIVRGLQRVEPDPGTLVVYATRAEATADDGDREHSPFATAFLKELPTPHLEVRRLFDAVRDDVVDATAHHQTPYTYGSLTGREDFFFRAQ